MISTIAAAIKKKKAPAYDSGRYPAYIVHMSDSTGRFTHTVYFKRDMWDTERTAFYSLLMQHRSKRAVSELPRQFGANPLSLIFVLIKRQKNPKDKKTKQTFLSCLPL